MTPGEAEARIRQAIAAALADIGVVDGPEDDLHYAWGDADRVLHGLTRRGISLTASEPRAEYDPGDRCGNDDKLRVSA